MRETEDDDSASSAPARAPDVSLARGRAPKTVDVVVPVYGAEAALRRCLSSLRAHAAAPLGRVILALDGPQPPGVLAVIAQARGGLPAIAIDVIEAPAHAGFVATANRGMAASTADVVLLNSDTEVTPGWLGKLAEAASSRPNVATVTPFSNDATICSIPRTLASNLLPSGHDAVSFGALVERVSRRARPELPTGVGFCLFVTRGALAAIGSLDGERFGVGYGEEVDFCLRARRAGFVNLLDDATFVWHQGGASFGADKGRREARAWRRLKSLHPGFEAALARFLREDPLGPLRERVLAALTPARRGSPARTRIAHVVHGWPPFAVGGTEQYARTLALEQAAHRPVAAHARLSAPGARRGSARELIDGGVRVRLVVNDFTQRNPVSRNALADRVMVRDLEQFLEDEEPGLVHVHHLAGHSIAALEAAAARGVPVVLQVQDWWGLCARANLYDRDGRRCPGPDPLRCARCLPLTALPGRGVGNPSLYALRRALVARAFQGVAAFVLGSEAAAGSFREAGLFPPGAIVRIVPLGIAAPPPGPRRAAAALPIRFGFIGALMPHKGPHLAVQAMAALPSGAATLTIHGNEAAAPEYVSEMKAQAPSNVSFHGRFEDDEKARVLSGIDVLLVPSIGLESFGIVAREAIAAGVPVVAADDGALSDLSTIPPSGELFRSGDAGSLADVLRRIVANPGILDTWRSRLPRPKTMTEHAREIENLYAEVLDR